MKLGEDWLNGFWAIEEKPGDGPLCPPPPPGSNRENTKINCSVATALALASLSKERFGHHAPAVLNFFFVQITESKLCSY